MFFEFDAEKSAVNKDKHGIDFVEAQQLWRPVSIELTSKHLKEARALVIGKINAKFWTAIITYRGNKIRIISVRRSRANEREYYEKINHG